MIQNLVLDASFNDDLKDYFKPCSNGEMALPFFAKFTKENLKNYAFVIVYDHDDCPKFMLRCYKSENFTKHFTFGTEYSWIPIKPDMITILSTGHTVKLDNIILKMGKIQNAIY